MAIEPESATERDKLPLRWRCSSGRTPRARHQSGETGQTLISGMGELHLEVIKNRLLRDFNLKVKFHKPQVSYRETIEHAVEVWGECHRQMAGQQLFARLRMRLEPLPGDASGDGPESVPAGTLPIDPCWTPPSKNCEPAAKAAGGSPAIR
jgi:elongation factor G